MAGHIDEKLEALLPVKQPRMKILNLGLCRTGTLSMTTALEQLGFHTYHMTTIFKTPSHIPGWTRALDAKYNGNGTWTSGDFEAILSDFDAICDTPGAVFVEELRAAYPDAKVIMTTRSAASWYRSMAGTIFPATALPGIVWFAPFEPVFFRPWLRFIRLMMIPLIGREHDLSQAGAERRFEEHNQRVRDVVGMENLLEFQAGKQGWKELCDFLGVEQPEGEFPNVNDKAEFAARMEMLSRRCVLLGLRNIALGLTAVGAVGYYLFTRY